MDTELEQENSKRTYSAQRISRRYAAGNISAEIGTGRALTELENNKRPYSAQRIYRRCASGNISAEIGTGRALTELENSIHPDIAQDNFLMRSSRK